MDCHNNSFVDAEFCFIRNEKFNSTGHVPKFASLLVCKNIKTNNIIEYDIINPNVYTSSNGLHYIISYYNQDDTELILTNSQYDLLKNDKNASYRITYYRSSGFVIIVEKTTINT